MPRGKSASASEDDVVVEEEPQNLNIGNKDEGGVEVDPDAPDKTKDSGKSEPIDSEALRKQIREELESDYKEKLRSVRNQEAAYRRQAEKYQKELEQSRSNGQAANQTATQPATQSEQDEYDQLVEKGDWKTAVRKMAAEEARRHREEERAKELAESSEKQRLQTLEESKKRVVDYYPELSESNGDPESQVSEAYRKVIEEDPSILSNPTGPEIAMYRMERILASQNIAPRSLNLQRQDDASAANRARASAVSLPPSRTSVPSSNKVFLTREEKQMCDEHGIDYRDYARNKLTLQKSGGIEA